MNQPDFALDVEWTDASGVRLLAHARGFDIQSFRANAAQLLATFGIAVDGLDLDGLPANSGTSAQRAAPAPTPIRQADTEPACPEHHIAVESRKYGGLYCPEQLEDGRYCRWTHGQQKRTRRAS